MARHVSGLLEIQRMKNCDTLFLPARGAHLSCAAAIPYYGAWILLLSIVTASRARALPDRLAAVFIVMLE